MSIYSKVSQSQGKKIYPKKSLPPAVSRSDVLEELFSDEEDRKKCKDVPLEKPKDK